MTDGTRLIATERVKQKMRIKPEHDLEDLAAGSLAMAGSQYAQVAAEQLEGMYPEIPPGLWPWQDEDFHVEETPLDYLIKAGALIAAEIDRILMERRKGVV